MAGRDALTAVAGAPIKPDDTAGAAFTVELPAPVPLANQLVVLTDRPLITWRARICRSAERPS